MRDLIQSLSHHKEPFEPKEASKLVVVARKLQELVIYMVRMSNQSVDLKKLSG